MTPPIITHDFGSRTTSVATSTAFNCSATGNPTPTITWYRNGQLLENSYLLNYDPPTLKFSSIDPEDQGIYECFARNDAGEIKISGHLTVRKREEYEDVDLRPFNVKCYPAKDSSLVVTYEPKQPYNFITYYIASTLPYQWQTPPPKPVGPNNSITIDSHLIPFRRHGIFLRGLWDGQPRLSRLSDPVECATQGVPIHYTVSSSSSIFIWWTIEAELTGYVIQFWHNDTDNPIPFTDNIVGTVKQFPNNDNYLTWSEIDPYLQKLPAVARLANYDNFDRRRRRRNLNFGIDNDDYDDGEEMVEEFSRTRLFARHAVIPFGSAKLTEVKVAGNVTGILIPNTQKVVVRVLASMEPDGEPLQQDLRYVPWQPLELNLALPKTKLQVTAETKSIKVSWSEIEKEKDEPCYEICYKNVVLINRGGKLVECRKM